MAMSRLVPLLEFNRVREGDLFGEGFSSFAADTSGKNVSRDLCPVIATASRSGTNRASLHVRKLYGINGSLS